MTQQQEDNVNKSKSKPKVTFNNREVGKVHLEYLTWQPDLPCEHHICQECCDSEWREGYGRMHQDREWFDTEASIKHTIWTSLDWRDVAEIRFTYDTSFLVYDMLDNNNNLLHSEMIPIGLIDSISISKSTKENTPIHKLSKEEIQKAR
jgi:hypothetical protein